MFCVIRTLTQELSDRVPNVKVHAVNAWSITAFCNKLDECGMFLSDGEANCVVELLGQFWN